MSAIRLLEIPLSNGKTKIINLFHIMEIDEIDAKSTRFRLSDGTYTISLKSYEETKKLIFGKKEVNNVSI